MFIEDENGKWFVQDGYRLLVEPSEKYIEEQGTIEVPEQEPDKVAILEAKNKALSDRQEFIEELIAEMAMMLYD